MKEETQHRLIDLLTKQMEPLIATAISSVIDEMMDDEHIKTFTEKVEMIITFPDYLTEKEAANIARKLVSSDGHGGARWNDGAQMFDGIDKLGIPFEEAGSYNKWAWYAMMNTVWSEEWPTLKNYVNNECEAKVIAEITRAKLTGKDLHGNVRWYFGL